MPRDRLGYVCPSVMPHAIRRTGHRLGRLLVAALSVLAAGCGSVGPGFVEDDQVNYSTALLAAEKRQLLLNIVRLRYGDIPSVMRVDQVVAGYERRFTGSIGSALDTDFDITDDFAIRGEGSIADRPTFTMNHLQGEEYARYMLRPLPPRELMALIATDASLPTAFGLAVAQINEVRNERVLSDGDETSFTFARVARLLQALRNEGLVQVEFEQPAEGRERVYLSLSREAEDERIERLTTLLDLDPTLGRYEIVLRARRRGTDEIAFWTRSFIQILTSVASSIPDIDPEEGEQRQLPIFRQGAATEFRIETGRTVLPPVGSFVRVRYDGRWFWIDGADARTKRAFSLLLLLSQILEREDATGATILTIPTN